MQTLLMIAALAEGASGVVLLAYPPIVIGLLFGGEIAGAGVIMSRIAGITLIALGVACWPKADGQQAFYGMLTYSMLAMEMLKGVPLGERLAFGPLDLEPLLTLGIQLAEALNAAHSKAIIHREESLSDPGIDNVRSD